MSQNAAVVEVEEMATQQVGRYNTTNNKQTEVGAAYAREQEAFRAQTMPNKAINQQTMASQAQSASVQDASLNAEPLIEQEAEQKGDALKKVMWAVIFIAFGLAMIFAPDLMDGAESATGRRSGSKNLLMMVWGRPAGFLAVIVGVFNGYQFVNRNK